MYYLKLTNITGVKGPDGKYKFKTNRIPIAKSTYNLLFNCRFNWWTHELSDDIDNDKVVNVIDDKLSDVFYLVVDQIIENKLGMTSNKDFVYEDVEYTENEIEVDIELIK